MRRQTPDWRSRGNVYRALAPAGLCVTAILLAVHLGSSPGGTREDTVVPQVAVGNAPTMAPGAAAAAAAPAVTDSFLKLQSCVYAAWEFKATEVLTDCSFYEGKPQFEQDYARCMNGWMD